MLSFSLHALKKQRIACSMIRTGFSTNGEARLAPGMRLPVNAVSPLKNFITSIIEDDLSSNKSGGRVVTRFPPEPNGYLHLGHAKSVNFNFGVARQYNGVTNMRFDDTNPAKEDMEYVNSILDDVRWLLTGSCKPEEASTPWDGKVRHASDYFPQIYASAEYLIEKGLAYVDDQSLEEIREHRGNRNSPGKDSPYRNRPVEENLRLFRAMRDRKFPDGHCVLRARIDMSSANMNMRDPLLFRIKSEAPHPLTGSTWCIYPMYDFAHAISDALEGITHSLCTLEFEAHRPLYDWVIDHLLPSGILPFREEQWRPQQIEFSRLNVQYTVLSKRKLIELVRLGHVSGWDDPRMPTVCGLRRRGYPHTALKLFCDRVGVTKTDSTVDLTILEDCVREVLEGDAPRLFAVLRPLKVTLTNWQRSEDGTELLSVDNHPKRPELGRREMPLTRSLFIEREDFFDTGPDGQTKPPAGYKRLLLGGQVRLRFAYVITCDDVVRNEAGQVVELRCRYDETSKGGATPSGAGKVKGVIPWVSERCGVPASVLLYDRLFRTPVPGAEGDFLQELNPQSLETLTAVVEPSVTGSARPGSTYQFERLGYFTVDSDSSADQLRFNRVVTLKDTWASQLAAAQPTAKPAAEGLDDFHAVDLRVGRILSASVHPSADLLYVLSVDCGDAAPRTIVSGLVRHFSAPSLVDRRVVVACNLKPAKLRGVLSEGMVLAASQSAEGRDRVELVEAPAEAVAGDKVRVAGAAALAPPKGRASIDVWRRVSANLTTTTERLVGFGAAREALFTSAGPCSVASLVDAVVS